MKTIVLMRHAKSSWADPTAKDINRHLNARGRIAAATMGAWLAEHGVAPDHIILSHAKRSQETWDRLQPYVGYKVKAKATMDVYMASPEQLLEILQKSPETADIVCLIGHQPGIGALASKLANSSAPSSSSRAVQGFPTAAIAILKADIPDWSKLKFGSAVFETFVLPKEVV